MRKRGLSCYIKEFVAFTGVVAMVFILSAFSVYGGSMVISSPAFTDGGVIPDKYAYNLIPRGQNISIPVQWRGAPNETKSFVFLMYDRHPVAQNWMHWIVIDIPSAVSELIEGSSLTDKMPVGAIELFNAFNKKGYGGPAAPKTTGIHEYACIVYALNVDHLEVDPERRLSYQGFIDLINGKVIEQAEMIGLYSQDPLASGFSSWGAVKAEK